jgi:hypothetical protein
MHQLHPLAGEAVGVVQLQRLPRRPCVGKPLRVACGVERRDRHLVATDVIGVRVTALFVVGHHHVRPELAEHPDQIPGRNLQRHRREAALGQRRLRIALGQS